MINNSTFEKIKKVENTFSPILAKGQLISKCLFGVFNSPKKQFDLRYHSSKVEFFYPFFWENSRYQKDIPKLTDL